MFKKLALLEDYINQCIKAYYNNKIGITIFLYYFPEIIINKYLLDKNIIDEDKTISKLSCFFSSYKWIKCERKEITKTEEQEIFDNKFILSDKKYKFNEETKIENDIIYYDNANNEELLSKDNVGLKLEDKLFVIIDEEFIILKKIILNKYKIIFRNILIKSIYEENEDNEEDKKNEENEDENNYIILDKIKFTNLYHKDIEYYINNSLIKKYNDFIYIINSSFIAIFNFKFELLKIINYYDESKLHKIYRIAQILIICLSEPKKTILFDLKYNQIITQIIGLSGNSFLNKK